MNRQLGGSEKNYWLANQFSTNNVISVINGKGKLCSKRLSKTLSALQQRHPSLRIHVIADADGKNPKLIEHGTPSIPLKHIKLDAKSIPNPIFNEQLEDQLNDSLDYEQGPLCRVTLIDANDYWCLMVCCSHMISDATSVMIIAKEILQGVSALENQDNLNLTKLPERPPLEACFPKQHQGLQTLPLVITSQIILAWQQMRKKPARITPQIDVPYSERTNCFLQKSLDIDTLVTLKTLCKKEGTSIHGILTAALSLSVAKELKEKNQLNSTYLGIGSPVNFRKDLPIDVHEELGTYICTLFSFVDISLDEWHLARAINNEIQSRYRNNEHFATLNLLKWLAPKSKEAGVKLIDYIERKGPGNVCVSNIGTYDLEPAYGSLKITSAEWFASLSVTGYLLMSVNTTLESCHLNFTYIDKIVPEQTAINIANNVEKLLHRLTNKLTQTSA